MVAVVDGLDDQSENTHVQGNAGRDHRIRRRETGASDRGSVR